ncbi:MAG: MBL fold metallo-hydrolase, partial [Synergistaceae bacterium]|nr:MBL fold metallo-hydrolase [Synergistaceae bacterium]
MLDSLEIITLMEDSVSMEGHFIAEHGLSFFIRGTKGGKEVRGLLDVGQTHESLAHNMRELGIGPQSADFVVLSHCHYDHTGGIAKFVESTGKHDFPVIANPALFRPHFVMEPVVAAKGVRTGDEREAIERAG